ncbi:unnamed protein product [Echinostoma caproni]|uniref:Flocculation protein FLO11-like n=1 Tax=Echinostoma caproni TaxID=27848 RepID=A0A183AG21_9TREM|nr:unnamed protein product [Echinostoma caproni]
MLVLTGTPSLVLASRVEVYHTCSVDLTWQRAIHSCQRCPRAVLVTNNVAIAPITQSNVERATSRFCPAGVHMSNCVPASEIFSAPNKQTVLKPLLTGAHANSVSLSSPGLNLSPSAWGPPNLPVPAVTHHHPVHTVHSARASLNSPTVSPSTVVIRESEKPTPQQITTGERAKLVVTKSENADKSTTTNKISPATPPPGTTVTTSISSATPTNAIVNTGKTEVPTKTTSLLDDSKADRSPVPEISIIRENESPKSPTSISAPSTRDKSQVNGTAEDRVITVPEPGLGKPTEREISLSNHVTENTSDGRVPDSTTLKKQRKEDTVQSVTRLKGGIASDALQNADVEIALPNRGSSRSVGQEEESDKARPNRASSRNTERSPASTKQSSASPLPATESPKIDANATRQPTTTTTVRDTREPGRHHAAGPQSPISSSGGGVGDVGPTPVKANGSVRADQSRATPVEPQSPPASKPPTLTTPSTQTKKVVPSFHFPLGTTRMTKEEISFEVDRAKRELSRIVESLGNGNKNGASDSLIPYSNFGQVAKRGFFVILSLMYNVAVKRLRFDDCWELPQGATKELVSSDPGCSCKKFTDEWTLKFVKEVAVSDKHGHRLLNQKQNRIQHRVSHISNYERPTESVLEIKPPWDWNPRMDAVYAHYQLDYEATPKALIFSHLMYSSNLESHSESTA